MTKGHDGICRTQKQNIPCLFVELAFLKGETLKEEGLKMGGWCLQNIECKNGLIFLRFVSILIWFEQRVITKQSLKEKKVWWNRNLGTFVETEKGVTVTHEELKWYVAGNLFQQEWIKIDWRRGKKDRLYQLGYFWLAITKIPIVIHSNETE